jgi:hypothetical protein
MQSLVRIVSSLALAAVLALVFGSAFGQAPLLPRSVPAPKIEETGAVGDKANAESKIWLPLDCLPGQFVVGMQINQASWVSQMQVLCVAPTASLDWRGDPLPGTMAGVANGGAHSALLLCPRNQWVSAISGKMAMSVAGMTPEQYLYLADPTLHCGRPREMFENRVSDPTFQRGQRRSMNNARYYDGPPEYCPPGMFAQSALVAIGGKNRIDVQAAKLRCVRFAEAQ